MEKLVTHLLALSLFIALTTWVNAEEQVITSCSQTPYPEVCRSMFRSTGDTVDASDYKSKSKYKKFRHKALKSTLECAMNDHYLAQRVNTRSFNPRAKAAFNDCLDLCQETIDLLNETINCKTYDDSQTWLSAASANQQTCLNGFIDFGTTYPGYYAYPFTSNNLTERISNSLAINKGFSPPGGAATSGGRRLLSDGFPEWLSAGDRKLLQSSVSANLVVAKDGSGDFTTISAAVAASSSRRSGTSRFVIHVKAGVYNENVEITKSMKNIMLVGDGIDVTVVTGSKNVQDGSTTFRSATVAIVGDGFIAKDMTFQNTAGPAKHQAVALRSGSDLSVYYRCSFKGYQDTLYVYSQRQFYRECDIYGTVDFIFGDAVAVLQNCNIFVRKPMSGQKNTVTAQGRTDPNENTGISIHNSVVTAASDLKAVQSSFKSYLGRPWQKYSRTVFMKSRLDNLIDPAGWLEWSGSFALSTLYYGEYQNTGAGADTSKRVTWAGYHVITSASEASKFTVGNFLSGDSWIPSTGVPFTSAL